MQEQPKKSRKNNRVKQGTALILAGLLVLVCLFYLLGEAPLQAASKSLTGSLDVAFGKRESNGVYLGKDDYLLTEPAAPNEANVSSTMTAINRWAYSNSYLSYYLMVVPARGTVLSEDLPAGVTFPEADAQLADVQAQIGKRLTYVDVSELFAAHSQEGLYYRTEDLWTTLGAYYGFQALAEAMGLDLSAMPALSALAVENDFHGSLAELSGFETGLEEAIYIYAAENEAQDPGVILSYDEVTQATLYDTQALDTSDAYDLFLGGDRGVTKIRTTTEGSDHLLIVKDAYANCLVPFLTYFYSEIVVVDPAQYSGNVKQMLKEEEITDVLFLYGADSFVTDESIAQVLGYDASE